MAEKDERRNDEGCLGFFTMADPSGAWVHITIREGATKSAVDDLMSLISGTTAGLKASGWLPVHEGRRDFYLEAPPKNGNEQPPEKPTEAAKETNGGRVPRPPSTGQEGWDTRNSPCAIARLLITGTKDRPMVQMWSPNPSLKFAAFEPTSAMVVNLLSDRYVVEQGVLDKLMDVGEEIVLRQPWFVHWEPSPKKSTWKDITTIDVASLVEKEPEPTAEENIF